MSEPITHITQVEIQQLWNEPELNIKWNLHRDVNILAGDNGSGKSTILNLILWSLLGTDIQLYENTNGLASSLSIVFNELSVVKLHRFKGNIKQLQKGAIANESLKSILQDVIAQEGENCVHKTGTIRTSYRTLNDKPFRGREEFDELLQVNDICTFDEPLYTLEFARKITGEEEVKTYLDLRMAQLEKNYLNYQVEIGKLALKALSSGTDIEEVRQVNQQLDAKKNLFLDMIDELFGATQKRVDRDNNGILFIKRGKTKLSPYNLSSGEKQMLMILLTALVQNNKPTVMIMDEPELSLHTDWQEKLIDYIRQLNENVQIIIATHSPSIVINGWQDKVFEINDILVK